MEENAKSRISSKAKDRRQPQSDSSAKKNVKPGSTNKDLPQLVALETFSGTSSVNEVLNEASKIVRIGMEREFAIVEKDNTLQNSSDTIENLRKNILHIQMEYEKLDQNYQQEISFRSEIVKRMDVTKDMVESAVKHSNTLTESIKQLEEDKFKIAEFYQLISQSQIEVEMKHIKVEKFLKEQDELLKIKLEDVKKSQEKTLIHHSEIVSQLSQELTCANDKLKIAIENQEKLEAQNKQFQKTINHLEVSIEKQQRQFKQLQESLTKYKYCIKKLKLEKFKYQKLMMNKKKQIITSRNQIKCLKKYVLETEILCNQYLTSNKLLELKNDEWKLKFEEHLEEDTNKSEAWKTREQELINKITNVQNENNDLKVTTKDLRKQIVEMIQNEKTKKTESDQLQNDLSKMFNENMKLKENLKKLSEENSGKAKLISDLEIKVNDFGNDKNSEVTFYKNESTKYQNLMKGLEGQVSELERMILLERSQKETIAVEWENKIKENAKVMNQKINYFQTLLEDKATFIHEIEFKLATVNSESQNAMEKLDSELQKVKLENDKLNRTIEKLLKDQVLGNTELENAKKQIMDFEKKLKEEKTSINTLEIIKNDFEETVMRLKAEIEREKNCTELLKEKHKQAEKELIDAHKVAEENALLKSSVAELKNLLSNTEAKVEAYKVAVKKLESEKFDVTNKSGGETSRLQSEISCLEETTTMNNDFHTIHPESSQGIAEKESDKIDSKAVKGRMMEWPAQVSNPHRVDAVVAIEQMEIENERLCQASSTSPKNTKTILSTPRKSFVATPKSNFRNITPVRKKRDPYEFDSDSSVERFDPDKVLKVFNRQKKETNKRPKTKI